MDGIEEVGKTDLLLLNGKIVTVDKEFTIAEAVAVKNGRVVAVGPSGKMEDWRGRFLLTLPSLMWKAFL